jgi:acetyl-CoA/propionyl-CoA carboxylase biotin carboxyl carrier protein
MNTRIQVEHPVTEMVTDVDLVKSQIMIAAGARMDEVLHGPIVHRGHSIECRINAEDPSRNFMPSPGTITHLRVPSGPGVRWDGGYTEGDAISQYYDNLVGKLIVWAPDRDRAIERMLRALDEFEIEGVRTTIPAHKVLLAHDDFRAARHSTKWVEDEIDQSQFAAPASAPAPAAADGAADADLVERTVPVEVDGRRFSVRVWLPPAPVGGGAAGPPARSRPKLTSSGSGAAVGDGTVIAPMQGTIVSVLLEVGATVEVGQAILVLEAMKMENHINAERSGTIAEIRVAAGDSVGTGDVLAIID